MGDASNAPDLQPTSRIRNPALAALCANVSSERFRHTRFSPAVYNAMASQTLSPIQLDETLRSVKVRPRLFDTDDLPTLIQSCEHAQFNSLDMFNTIKLLVQEVIGQRVANNIYASWLRELTSEVNALKSRVNNIVEDVGTDNRIIRFDSENLRKTWKMPSQHPFKVIDLTMELSCYVPPKRVRHKLQLEIVDFFRKIFTKACIDPSDIWSYGVRIKGSMKDITIVDLPHEIVTTLTDFTMQAMGLDVPELSNGDPPTESSFWKTLGKNDWERQNNWKELHKAKMTWPVKIMMAMGDALDDIRAYRFFQGNLHPPHKNGKPEKGFGRADKLKMTAEQWEVIRSATTSAPSYESNLDQNNNFEFSSFMDLG